ncbi:hypothetical protein [Streptomyces lacrimifluminis]|uniref:Uncharacterized protein n=1 Tax=Streptomyces lacrimifluminis TaxID=1500077 RepID=A0A917L8F9_9ACTN|nr:hypothetical protein [Streptomyces lacrimifluminis]GGJ49485.1 hypothetical protein GCM10012282_52900 [Streptomyces lacrimifluminis]
MLALRLARGSHPGVQLRRLLVATASAATGFLLLGTLGHALAHQDTPGGSALRLAWCVAPLAATVHFAVTVARTDPGTRPRPGLSAIGLGPARLMAVSATTTALSCTLGSMLALLFFLHLRGDLTGMPFDGDASDFLASDHPLPLPAALTLLTLVPVAASVAVALVLRPRDVRPRRTAGSRAAGAAPVPQGDGTPSAPGSATDPSASTPGAPDVPAQDPDPDPHALPTPHPTPRDLPWGIAVLAAGLAVEAYAARAPHTRLAMPGGATDSPAAVLVGWTLTAVGLALAGPGLAHLCGRLLQAVRPGALRLLAGRVLMEEATRIGRPLGVVCAVASGAYAMIVLYDDAADDPSLGPLTTLGALVVAGCAVATLLTAAAEARRARADTTAALVRLGAPATTLRTAAGLRAAALLALFAPLTFLIAELAALPLTA